MGKKYQEIPNPCSEPFLLLVDATLITRQDKTRPPCLFFPLHDLDWTGTFYVSLHPRFSTVTNYTMIQPPPPGVLTLPGRRGRGSMVGLGIGMDPCPVRLGWLDLIRRGEGV